MKTNRTNLLTAVAVVAMALAACVTPAKAIGFRVVSQDAEAISMGNAFTATADNNSAIYYNPAGLTQAEGFSVRSGVYAISMDTRYTSLDGREAHTNDSFQYVPNVYYAFKPEASKFAFGFGIYSPYGLAVEWPTNSGFRTITTDSKMIYLTANPVVAYEVLPGLSVAGGLTVNYGNLSLKQGIAMPGDEFKFKGDGWAVGWTAGLLWKPCNYVSFGVNYRSETRVDFSGHVEAKPYAPQSDADGAFTFPQNVVLGVAFHPVSRLTLSFDADWTQWSRMGTVTLNTPGTRQDIPFNWHSGWVYSAGARYQLGRGFYAATGYSYAEGNVSDATWNPAISDTNIHVASIGAGYKGKRWDFAVAYQLGINGDKEINGSSRSRIGETADGNYRPLNNAIAASMTFHFF